MSSSEHGLNDQGGLDAGRILALGREHREGAHTTPHPECSRCRVDLLDHGGGPSGERTDPVI